MSTHQRFLQFNGKNIIFLNVDGTYWIAINPICEALNIDASRSYKNAKKDPIIGPALAVQPVQVSKNGIKQVRNMTCIPEKYIYGWIFSLRSDSEELTQYKKTCYEILYNHFHGTITNRKELLLEKRAIETELFLKREELKNQNEIFSDIEKLELIRKRLNHQLLSIDKELIKTPELFQND